MIVATPVSVPTGSAITLGTFTQQTVIISNQGGNTIYLGTSSSVTTANGVGVPTGSAPLNLGVVSGVLYATAAIATTVVGVLVTTAR